MAEIAYISLLLCAVILIIGYFINKRMQEWTYWYISLASFILFSFAALYSDNTNNGELYVYLSMLAALILLLFTFLRIISLLKEGINYLQEARRSKA